MDGKMSKVKIAIFDGQGDFSLWKRRMLAHMSLAGVKDEVATPAIAPAKLVQKKDEPADEYEARLKEAEVEKAKRAEKAMDMLTLHLGDHVLRKTEECKTARDLWEALERLYNTKTLPSRIYLLYQFYTFKMDGSKSIDQNVDDFLKTVSELASVKNPVADEVQAILLLSSLPSQYDSMKETLKFGRESLSIEDVINAAKSKEMELKAKGISTSQKAGEAYSVTRGRSFSKGNPRDRSRSRSKSGTRVTCWFCKKEGHKKADCYAWKKSREDGVDGEAAVVIDSLEVGSALSVSPNWLEERWIIDSGCSYHMTSRRDWFDTFEELKNGQVLTADDGTMVVEGIGTINIKAYGGTVKTLTNVRYLPTLRRNLISTGTMDRMGFVYTGGHCKKTFYKNGKMGLQGTLFGKTGTLYLLDGETVAPQSNSVVSKVSAKDETVLWHRRLGHMSMKNMMILVKRGIIDKRRIGELSFCESCVMGKHKKVSFHIGRHDSGTALKYVHADLWGSPSVTPSLSGKLYFLSIIDDFTRKVWVFFLSAKSEAFTRFCEWKKLVENQVSKKVKCLRTDNGLEFVNKDFDGFCTQHGIERHKTCPYTPQQNGVAERMNRTIMEKVRCLLDESGLDEVFWAEAVNTAVYQINRSPTSALDGNIPEELWLGRKPGYQHMRRFGSLVYVHTDQGKLKPRALKGVFIGYPEGVKGYKVWLLDEEKCVVNRNVMFVEDQVFKDLQKTISGRETEEERVSAETVSIDTLGSVDRQESREKESSNSESSVDRHPPSVDRHGRSESSVDRHSSGVDRHRSPSVDRQRSSESRGRSVDRHTPSVDRQSDSRRKSTGSDVAGPSASRGRAREARVSGGVTQREDVENTVEASESDKEEESLENYQLAKDRKRRPLSVPRKYDEYDMAGFALIAAVEMSCEEPRDYQEAMESRDKTFWNGGMNEEMGSLEKNKTWILVRRPKNRKVIGCKWVYRLKPGIPGVEEPRYKARLVAKGYSQREGIDYQEVFSPVVKHVSIRFLLSITVNLDLELEQLDVKTAFLHGLVEEEIYMEQPEGYVVKGKEDHVCLLKKALYGLKQAPRQWNKCFDQFVVGHGFERSEFDHCVYIKSKGACYVYLLLYVDDMLIASQDMREIQVVKDLLSSRFEMKDLGAARRILGMDIERDRKGGVLTLSQSSYIKKIIQVFNMDESRSVSTPIGSHFKLSAVKDGESETIMDDVPYSNAVGSIMYAMMGTRCDLAYAVGLVSRFMSKPSMVHWTAVKWVLRYLKGSQDLKIVFRKNEKFKIEGFCDSDFSSDLDRSRSISGYVFTAGGSVVSWKSSLQHVVALSTTEAEYMALVEAVKEAIWLQGLAEEFGFKQDSVEIWCDSQSALSLAKNNVHHERTKHINRKLHFIRDIVASGEVKLSKIPTEINPADMLTKVLPVEKFEKACRFLGLAEH